MKVTTSGKARFGQIAMFSMVGVTIMGLAQSVGAFGNGSAGSYGGDVCTYSVQLQQSVSVRRDYLVKLDQVRGSSYMAGNGVEEMYDNIVPASYNDDDDDEAGAGSISLIFGVSKKSAARSANDLDSFTVDCLGCHDGLSASSIGVDYRDRPHDRGSRVVSSKSDHPIGMSYDMYVAASRGYKNVGTSTKMVFVNGKVGCLTCHDPLNPEKGHLVMSDANSALCRTCHDK